MELSSSILSDVITFLKYSRFLPDEQRRETWPEIVKRNKDMHLKKFQGLDMEKDLDFAYDFVLRKEILPSARSLQFAGKPIELMPNRLYNCSYVAVDDISVFSEIMFLLLGGSGVGFSVQFHHVKKLPEITHPTKTKRHLIGDSIEGWSDAVKTLINSYFGVTKYRPRFDYNDIRPKGTVLKTSGGLAPGPEPLKDCLHNIKKVLDRKANGEKLKPIEAHDIICYIADCVLAGGIRRSATISLFSMNDEEMLTCKFGNWYELNPQRARANNSAVIIRHKIKEADFKVFWEKIRASGSGEPGFLMSQDKEVGTNPCGEVSLRSNQFCNLVNLNAGTVNTQEELNERAKAAAIIATCQAAYTDFNYLRDEWREVTEKEALIGIGLCGIASGNVLKLDLKEAVSVALETNERIAKKIGINKAARCTVVKPDGQSSLLLGTSSGIHAWHSEFFIRRIRINKEEPIYKYLKRRLPHLIEDDFLKPTTDAILSFPIKAPKGAITRKESAIDLLERVKFIYENWILPGHRKGPNTNNVSTTVSIKNNEWFDVGDWMWENKNSYTALSVLPYDDHTYVQTPFEEITKKQYDEMLLDIKEIDLTKIMEVKDSTKLQAEAACAGGACEIL